MSSREIAISVVLLTSSALCEPPRATEEVRAAVRYWVRHGPDPALCENVREGDTVCASFATEFEGLLQDHGEGVIWALLEEAALSNSVSERQRIDRAVIAWNYHHWSGLSPAMMGQLSTWFQTGRPFVSYMAGRALGRFLGDKDSSHKRTEELRRFLVDCLESRNWWARAMATGLLAEVHVEQTVKGGLPLSRWEGMHQQDPSFATRLFVALRLWKYADGHKYQYLLDSLETFERQTPLSRFHHPRTQRKR